jgi:hypothetical protein
MASNYKKEPIFVLERAWDNKTKMPKKYKFQGTAGKAEVHISSGALGMVLSQKTLPQFNQAGTRLDWTWGESFSELANVLADRYKTIEVLHRSRPKQLLPRPSKIARSSPTSTSRSTCSSKRSSTTRSQETFNIFTWHSEVTMS